MTESVVVRRSLGRRLKALRNQAGKTAADVAVAGIASRAKLARIESGVGPVKMADVRALCWLYGVDPDTTDTLADLALNITVAGRRWEDHRDPLPQWLSMFIELESAAASVLVYEGELVYGLLQTAAYQRAVFMTGYTDSSEIERRVDLRTGRQRAAFDRPTPLRVSFLMSEAVLLREVGGPSVIAEQRAHLRTLAHEPHLDLRVVPCSAGAHPSMQGPYVVLEFGGDHPDVLYFEQQRGACFIEDPATIRDQKDRFARTRAVSVSMEEFLG